MGKTWFSFSFLASLRMIRVLYYLQKNDEYSNSSSWRKQIGYHSLLLAFFVYVCGVLIMTFELLETPRRNSWVPGDDWNAFEAIGYMASTVFTLGDNRATPTTIL